MSVGAFMDALYTKLTADQTAGSLYDALGGRIYNGFAIEEASTPYLCFSAVTGVPERHMGGPVSLDVTVQFDLFGNIELGSKALHDIEVKLYALLEGVSIAPTGFDRGVCTFTTRGAAIVDDDCWRVMDEIQIRGTDF